MNEQEFQKCDNFVNKEVYANVNDMVEFILNSEDYEKPFSLDDIDNFSYWYCPECGDENNGEKCQSCDYEKTGEEDLEYQEIFEWWIVSSWLGEKLRENGYPVIERGWGGWLWGRTTSGQSISLDGIVQKLVKESL
jgi:hypothetical protein